MKKRLLLLICLCIAAVTIAGCLGGGTEVPPPPENGSGNGSGGDPGNGSGGNGSGSGSATITGEITGTLDGEPFTRYTLETTDSAGQYHNYAEYERDILEGIWDLAHVSLQGHRSRSMTDFEHAISVDFALDVENNWEYFTIVPDEPPEIYYFPEGLVFDPERVFMMTDGTLDIISVKLDGDILKVQGEFAGTLSRQELDKNTGNVTTLETKQIEGEFDIHKATPLEQ